MQFQFDNYGNRLNIPGDRIKLIEYDFKAETLEEIERLMRKKPHSPRMVV